MRQLKAGKKRKQTATNRRFWTGKLMKENILNKPPYTHRVQLGRWIKILTFCCLLVIVSCKAKKQVIVNRTAPVNVPKPPDNRLAQINAIKASQVNFNTFSGKAKAKLDISGSSNDVTL